MEILCNHFCDGLDRVSPLTAGDWKTVQEYANDAIRATFNCDELIGEDGTRVWFLRGEHYNDGSAYYEEAEYNRAGICRIMAGRNAEPVKIRTYGTKGGLFFR